MSYIRALVVICFQSVFFVSSDVYGLGSDKEDSVLKDHAGFNEFKNNYLSTFEIEDKSFEVLSAGFSRFLNVVEGSDASKDNFFSTYSLYEHFFSRDFSEMSIEDSNDTLARFDLVFFKSHEILKDVPSLEVLAKDHIDFVWNVEKIFHAEMLAMLLSDNEILEAIQEKVVDIEVGRCLQQGALPKSDFFEPFVARREALLRDAILNNESVLRRAMISYLEKEIAKSTDIHLVQSLIFFSSDYVMLGILEKYRIDETELEVVSGEAFKDYRKVFLSRIRDDARKGNIADSFGFIIIDFMSKRIYPGL